MISAQFLTFTAIIAAVWASLASTKVQTSETNGSTLTTRQFYSPYGAGTGFSPYRPYNQQFQQFPGQFQQYPNNGQFQQFPNNGQFQQFPGAGNNFLNSQQGFLRPPIPPIPTIIPTTTAATTAAAAATTVATTTTTTARPLQPGVTTLFPLVGPGTGFQRPGNQNVLPGQPVFPFGQYPYFGKKK